MGANAVAAGHGMNYPIALFIEQGYSSELNRRGTAITSMTSGTHNGGYGSNSHGINERNQTPEEKSKKNEQKSSS